MRKLFSRAAEIEVDLTELSIVAYAFSTRLSESTARFEERRDVFKDYEARFLNPFRKH